MTDPGRRAGLLSVKLGALVRDHLAACGADASSLRPAEFAGGAALLHGDEAWVLVADRGAGACSAGLGGPLAWALRRGASRLHVVVDDDAGGLARRAGGFALPVAVWRAADRMLARADAVPLPTPAELPSSHRGLEAVIVAGGAEPVVEHGVLAGEVLGLEVCRVVDDEASGAARLEIGIGDHDREAFRLLHGDVPPAEALAGVVETVRANRGDPSGAHPLARLARERLLRALLVARPSTVGAAHVEPVASPEPRRNLKDPAPCVALAHGTAGTWTLVVSTGVDLDAVPTCVDARVATGVERCVLVVPPRDALPVQRSLAAAAVPPIEVATFDIDAGGSSTIDNAATRP